MVFTKTTELINSQYIDGKFNRMDLVVRYMYIKEYVEKNNEFDATNIYLQMLHKRHLGNEHIKRTGERYISDFNVLIEDFKLNGFNNRSPIKVDSNSILWDGSHRMTTSYYFGIEEIPMKVVYPNNWGPPDTDAVRGWGIEEFPIWGFDWFVKNDFSDIHLEQINTCFERYFKVNV